MSRSSAPVHEDDGMGMGTQARTLRSIGFVSVAIGAATLFAGPFDDLKHLFKDDAGTPAIEIGGEAGPAESISESPAVLQPGVVNCANLVYGDNRSSVCFSSEFLSQVSSDTHIRTQPRLVSAHLESVELFQFPFAVMTGEGSFSLSPEQRRNMRDYLQAGGFIVASAGCSSEPWRDSFLRELALVFPELALQRLEFDHPIFHTVYDIDALKCKGAHQAHLEGLEIDGKIVLIFSADGLNDTANAGGNCCCCGGNEIKNSRQMNVNMLAYTLTH
jgi:hypothetical protein